MAGVRTGRADLPLHGGHCPPWLFARMRALAAAIAEVVVAEFGPPEFLRRLSDPIWFQAFGAVLGFDWHSSGLTTVVCGALKEGTADRQADLGLFFAGGKGPASRRTPAEIAAAGERHGLAAGLAELERASRLAAKVDSAAVQDGFGLYHHFFAFDRSGRWAVVQQGLRPDAALARRYHWLGEAVADFTREPHAGVVGPAATGPVLNMVAHDSAGARAASLDLTRQPVAEVLRDLAHLRQLEARAARMAEAAASGGRGPLPLSLFGGTAPLAPGADTLVLGRPHPIPNAGRIDAVLARLYERRPEEYADLLLTPGVGPATVRALAMVAEVAYGAPPARSDPVRYAFAHGGKDGHPFPVRRADYDRTVAVLETALRRARVGQADQLAALRRLARWETAGSSGGAEG